jgi:hypothetical protein
VEHLFPLLSADEICLLKQVAKSLKVATLYPASSPLARECHWLVTSAPPQGNIDHRSQVLRIAAAVLSVEIKNARSQRVGTVRIRDHKTRRFEELSVTEFATLSVHIVYRWCADGVHLEEIARSKRDAPHLPAFCARPFPVSRRSVGAT